MPIPCPQSIQHLIMGKGTEVFDFDSDEEAVPDIIAAKNAHRNPNEVSSNSKRESIDLFRRAMPEVEVDEDVCSICLDAFTDDDPGNVTVCEHTFHLQCIMQWAQRSRECPLCFKTLAMQDTDLQELLPFGEYVPQDLSGPATSALLGIEPWDMDRLLQRLALQNTATSSRRSRPRSRSRPYSMPGAPSENIRVSQHVTAEADTNERGQAHTHASSSQIGEGDFPSSWPPSAANMQGGGHNSSESDGMQSLKRGGHPDVKPAGESLKTRWSNFQNRWRESLSRSTSGLRNKSDRNGPASPAPVQPQRQ